MKRGASKLDQLEKEYSALLSLAEAFLRETKHEIEVLLERDRIPLLFPIQARVKSWASIQEKIDRLKLSVSKVIELQDLVGLRIVLLFERDLASAIRLIETNFNIFKKYNTAHRLKEDQFGYSSIHLLAKVPDEWLKVPSTPSQKFCYIFWQFNKLFYAAVSILLFCKT